MAGPGFFLLLSLGILGILRVETSDSLMPTDSSFCHGEMKLVYEGLDVDRCLTIPENLRNKISTATEPPEVYFPAADVDKKYVLVMVDPDAPSRLNPTSSPWRHWLVVDIKGRDLKNGLMDGITLTDYRPPTPPRGTGFHRYQFMLFEQTISPVTLSEEEQTRRGNWNLQGFAERFNLGNPVAALQFLTQNYMD